MTTRELLPAGRLPLVGGRLCLDFVNTTGARRSGRPRERLAGYGDLVAWSVHAGVLSVGRGTDLLRRARGRQAADRTLSRLLAFREALYRLLLAQMDGATPRDEDLAGLNRLLTAAARSRRLVHVGPGLAWRWPPPPDPFHVMFWPIAQSAADLLTSEDVARIRKCGECDWLFVDETKNGSRRWCKKLCGDRVKARRYYRRRTASGGRSSTPGRRSS